MNNGVSGGVSGALTMVISSIGREILLSSSNEVISSSVGGVVIFQCMIKMKTQKNKWEKGFAARYEPRDSRWIIKRLRDEILRRGCSVVL